MAGQYSNNGPDLFGETTNLPFKPSKNFIRFRNSRSEIEKKLLFDKVISTYKLSASHINKYNSCSKAFLYECLLKVKYPPNIAMVKGSIVHNVLDLIFKFQKQNNYYPSTSEVKSYFDETKLTEEKKSGLQLSKVEETTLQEMVIQYFSFNKEQWNTIALTEFYIRNCVWNGIPLTGFIDKIEFHGKNINIVDYKTGNIERALVNIRIDKPYWFQLCFYVVMMEIYKPEWNIKTVEMCMVAPLDNCVNKKLTISEEQKAAVKEKIIKVYDNIKSYQFDGCKNENCYWCKNY